MSWHKATFTTEQIEEQQTLVKLEDQFEKLFMVADGPEDMALFSDNNYKENEISIYFTPGCNPSCEELINQYDGKECDPPLRGDVFLLAGNDDASDLLA
jgi:hypothetical protein